MKRSTLVLAAAAMAVVLSGCSQAQLTDLAKDTCAELDGAIVLQVGPILNRAISDADDLGFSGPELGDKMREECPLTMAALDEVGEEQERKDNLPNEMRVVLDRCTSNGANGTVTNNSDVTVDVWVDVQYLNGEGTIIDDGLDGIDRIRPGETAIWEDERYSDISGMKTCRAEVSSAYES